MTRSGNLPANANLLTDEYRDRTIIYRGAAWLDILRDLGARGVTRLLVEGGGDVLGQLSDQNLIDEIWCFIAPLLTGGDKPSFGGAGIESLEAARRLRRIRYKRLGSDVLVIGHV